MFVAFKVVPVTNVQLALTVSGIAPQGLSLAGGGGGGPQVMFAVQPAALILPSEVNRRVRHPPGSLEVRAGGSVVPE